MTRPRVRCRSHVVLRADPDGNVDPSEARRACDSVLAGDDVVVLVRGRIGVDPGVAALVGRCLYAARTVEVEGTGPYVRLFTRTLCEAAELEADARRWEAS